MYFHMNFKPYRQCGIRFFCFVLQNRELNLELRFPFCFFKLISMGKTLWGEKILKHIIYLCSNGFSSMLFMNFRIVFNNYCLFWHSSVYNCEYFAQNKNFLSHPQTKSPCFNSPWNYLELFLEFHKNLDKIPLEVLELLWNYWNSIGITARWEISIISPSDVFWGEGTISSEGAWK